MFQAPSGPTTKLCDHDVAIAKQFDVKLDMRNGLNDTF